MCVHVVSIVRGTNLILSGAYTDFSPSWYTDVGQSLQLLIIINAVVTGGCAHAHQTPHGITQGIQHTACLKLHPKVTSFSLFMTSLLPALTQDICTQPVCLCLSRAHPSTHPPATPHSWLLHGHVVVAQGASVLPRDLLQDRQPVGLERGVDRHGLCVGRTVSVCVLAKSVMFCGSRIID